MSSHPYVFISYSHDSEPHRLRVASLARQLRLQGVDAHVDWEEPAPPQGWTGWMHGQVERADFVLVVCTETYRRRAEGREGPGTGTNIEGAIISQQMHEAGMVTRKFIPVVFDAAEARSIPWFLRGRTWYDVSGPRGYDALYRILTGQPEVELGELGERVALPRIEVPPLHAAEPSPPPPAAGAAGALVGLAIDVSGSMAGSMPRSLGPSSSRLEAVRGSLERIAREALDAQRTAPADDSGAMLFALAFGLRIGSVCDLLSLVKVAKDVVTPADIDAARDEVEAEARQKYGDLADRLSGFLGRGAVQQAARRMGEAAVRARVMGVAQERIRQRLAAAGDTTVRAGALAEMWGESSATLQNAEEFIFGDTPMREALQAVADRFERERGTLPDAPRALFILSDGEPTDGDPRPLARRLADAGVTIVSCFVTDRDVTAPRTLFQAAQPGWSEGARLMFDLATPAGPANPFVHPLLRQGWTVPQGARLFVQVNHSEVLEEFVRGLLGYLDATGQALPPRGT